MTIRVGGKAPLRLVVMVSGTGSNLAALMEACRDPQYGAVIVAVGADREDIEGLARAERAGIPTFAQRVSKYESRAKWDQAMCDLISEFKPDLIVSAGFMKLFGAAMLTAFPGRIVNTHPALCPAFPGTSAPAEALAYGVKFTGATLFVVDEGVDSGPIVAQCVVTVCDDDDAASLHERIKVAEREMLVAAIGRIAREGMQIEGRRVWFGS